MRKMKYIRASSMTCLQWRNVKTVLTTWRLRSAKAALEHLEHRRTWWASSLFRRCKRQATSKSHKLDTITIYIRIKKQTTIRKGKNEYSKKEWNLWWAAQAHVQRDCGRHHQPRRSWRCPCLDGRTYDIRYYIDRDHNYLGAEILVAEAADDLGQHLGQRG